MLAISEVSKRYGSQKVLDQVTATIPKGSLSLILGPNGAGKTTLARCILGLTSYEGEITWNGSKVRPSNRLLFPVFEDPKFYQRLTGRQNMILLGCNESSKERMYVSDTLLRQRVSKYSHGERVRLGLTMALNSGAELIILDEPTNGLDQESMSRLREDLSEMKKECTFLAIGHQLGFYNPLVDHIFALQNGQLHILEMPASAEEVDLARIYAKHYAPDRF